MKNRFFRTLSLFLLLTLLASVTVPALAAETAKPKLPDRDFWEVWEMVPSVMLSDMNLPEEAELVKVKSSKPKVLKAEIYGSSLSLLPLKAGKSKITLTYKVDGKKGTLTKTYTVMKYPKPIASLKVDSKKVNLTKNKAFCWFKGYKKTKTTIDLKLNKGWTIVSMEHTSYDKNYENVKNKMLKSLKNIKTAKNLDFDVRIVMKNKKGQEYSYRLDFVR